LPPEHLLTFLTSGHAAILQAQKGRLCLAAVRGLIGSSAAVPQIVGLLWRKILFAPHIKMPAAKLPVPLQVSAASDTLFLYKTMPFPTQCPLYMPQFENNLEKKKLILAFSN
jgi:hypothetical protein